MTERPGQRVVIVGAGLAGLAAGTWLVAKGFDVKILEATDRPGGRALTLHRPDDSGDRVDVGTQYFHTSYRRAKSLIEGVGLTPSLSRIRGRTRFFDDRAPGGTFTTGHRVPFIRAGSLWDNAVLTLRGLARLAFRPIDTFAAKPYPKLDQRTVGEAVRDPFEWDFTARTLIAAGALVEPAGEEVSYLHLIRLMRIILMTDYLSLAGGTASLHEALAEPLDIAYEAPIASLIWDGAARGVLLVDGTRCDADHVILAIPPNRLSEILPLDWSQERGFLDGIRHPPAVIVTFWLDGPLEPGIWSYFFPAGQGLISFCTDAAQKNPAMVPSGRAALQAWICWPGAEQAMTMDDAKLTAEITRELSERFAGITNRIESVHVQRHAHAVPQTPPGHAGAVMDFLDKIDQRPGLQICGDFLTGGYIESAMWSAERAILQIDRNIPLD